MTEPSRDIPKRASYKPAEVCEIARIQPYVLRSWESEFPRLGVVRAGQRVYRHADLEQVLKIKQLVFDEGLTLAGARRRLEEENEPQPELPLEELVTPELKERIGRVRQGLHDLMAMLGEARDDTPAKAASSGGDVAGPVEPRPDGQNGTAREPVAAPSAETPKAAERTRRIAKPRAKRSRPRVQAASKSKGARRTRRA